LPPVAGCGGQHVLPSTDSYGWFSISPQISKKL